MANDLLLLFPFQWSLQHDTWWWARMCQAVSEERWYSRWQSPPKSRIIRRKSKLDSKAVWKRWTLMQPVTKSTVQWWKVFQNEKTDTLIDSIEVSVFVLILRLRWVGLSMRGDLSGDQALPPIVKNTDLRAAGEKFLQGLWKSEQDFQLVHIKTKNCVKLREKKWRSRQISDFGLSSVKRKVSEIVFQSFFSCDVLWTIPCFVQIYILYI